MTMFNLLYDLAIPFKFRGDRESLKALQHEKFEHTQGSILQSMDMYGRRVMVFVGEKTNIVVFDRYPDLRVGMYLFHAPPNVSKNCKAVLGNEDLNYLRDMSWVV